MSDGVLKSDPDAVWNYVVSLNENKEYVDEAVKGAKDALESLLQRLNQKRSSIADKRSEWEDQIRFYADESESEQDPKKQEDYRKKIEEARKNGRWDAPKPPAVTEDQIAAVTDLLKGYEPAHTNFLAMSQSVKKTYTRAYFDAKTDAGREKRTAWMVDRLNKNLKPM